MAGTLQSPYLIGGLDKPAVLVRTRRLRTVSYRMLLADEMKRTSNRSLWNNCSAYPSAQKCPGMGTKVQLYVCGIMHKLSILFGLGMNLSCSCRVMAIVN